MRQIILHVCEDGGNEPASEVRRGVFSSILDLHATDAQYHRDACLRLCLDVAYMQHQIFDKENGLQIRSCLEQSDISNRK